MVSIQQSISSQRHNHISIAVPIGSYEKYYTEGKGFATLENGTVVELGDTNHYIAASIFMEGNGFIGYKIKNITPQNSRIKSIGLSFMACPHSSNQSHGKAVMLVRINGNKAGVYTIDCGRGESCTIINFESREEIKSIENSIDIAIEVYENETNDCGIGITGKRMRNTNHALELAIEYEGEKIYQPKISEIVSHPINFINKTVIIYGHPAGWACPSMNSTLLPQGFSRSSIMVYDGTGCIYSNGSIMAGKILSPSLHPIFSPGNETIVIKGKVMVDRNGVPFISK